MSVISLAYKIDDEVTPSLISPVRQHYEFFDFTLGQRNIREGSGTLVHWNIEARAFWYDHRRRGECYPRIL